MPIGLTHEHGVAIGLPYPIALYPAWTMDTADDDFYQDRILDHYEDPFHRGRCRHATHEHEEKNPLCGDIVHIDLAIGQGGKIDEVYFDGDGCCISQASASMLLEQLDGKTVDEVKNFTAADMLKLFGAKLTPNRQKCCLLAWRTLQSALHSPLDRRQNGEPPPDRDPDSSEES